jgi:hypothetical protein
MSTINQLVRKPRSKKIAKTGKKVLLLGSKADKFYAKQIKGENMFSEQVIGVISDTHLLEVSKELIKKKWF